MSNVEVDIPLPALHADQARAYETFLRNRFTVMRCGRRWGKTKFCCILASDYAIGDKQAVESRGRYVEYFAPEYKFLAEAYTQIEEFLHPVKKRSTRQEGKIVTQSGGEVDFWTLDNDKAGLGRRYHLVVVDEAASTKPNMMDFWEKSIKGEE